MNIKELIKQLEEMQEKGYKKFFITISDGDDSWDADYLYLNEGVLTDGTEVLDMDIVWRKYD
jgi:hypothetical protein